MNTFIMESSVVRPATNPYGRLDRNSVVGYEGEHNSRSLVVETTDDLSAYASVSLIIDDLDCGAMTKTTSGSKTVLSLTLTSAMIGASGRKLCQLLMVDSNNTVIAKSSQFVILIKRSNDIERSVEDGVSFIIISEAVTEMAQEAASAAAQEAAADVVAECQMIANTAAGSASAAAQSAAAAQAAAESIVVDSTLDTASTNAIQNKAVASEISSIKADLGSQDAEIYNVISGSFSFSASDFEKGGIGNSGENSTYRSVCRVRNKKVQYTAEKITLTASSGYKVCVAIYASYNLSSWTESITLGTLREVPANTYYRIFIDKTDGSETDVSTLLSALSVVRDSRIERMASSVSDLDAEITTNRSILATDGGMVLYFEKGSINTSGDSTYFADSRIRTGMLSFGADLIFSAKDSTLTNAFQVLTYNSDGIYKDSSGWVKTYSISRGTKFRIMASLTPNENTSASVQSILSAFSYKFDFTTEFDPVPAYYFEDDYLDDKISDIISYYALSPSLLTFGFITDTHMLVNAGHGFKLLKYIDEHTNSIPFVIFGGDCIGHTQSKDDVYAQAGAWIDYMSDYDKRRVLQCRGNHDLLGDQNDSLLSRSERFMYLVRNQNMVMPSANNFYYYYDVPYTDVRIIVVDDYDGAASGGAPKFTQTQIDWILGTALNVSNKNIVFITHNTADPDLGWYVDNMEPLHLIMDALKTKSNLSTTSREMVLSHDFTGDTNTLVCCLCGHGHNDENHVDASGVLSIMTNCDGNATSTSGYDRTVGTVNEQCFDVVTIDTENRHIYMTRIGAGNDRDFSY